MYGDFVENYDFAVHRFLMVTLCCREGQAPPLRYHTDFFHSPKTCGLFRIGRELLTVQFDQFRDRVFDPLQERVKGPGLQNEAGIMPSVRAVKGKTAKDSPALRKRERGDCLTGSR